MNPFENQIFFAQQDDKMNVYAKFFWFELLLYEILSLSNQIYSFLTSSMENHVKIVLQLCVIYNPLFTWKRDIIYHLINGNWGDYVNFVTQIIWIKKQSYNNLVNYHQIMNTNPKRGWMPEEDQILLEMVAAANSQKLKWVQVAKVLFEKLGKQRTGKQCRQRWQHQLNPTIIRDQWTQNEQMRLFQLQSEYGNKWALIAEKLPGRTDNAVKNFFYSAVRKVFTRVNMFLVKNRNCKQFKSIRQFEADFLSKLMAVVDGNYSKKIRLTSNDAVLLAKKILQNVTVLSITHGDDACQSADQNFTNMVKIMHDFRKSCKKRKQRKNEYQKISAEMEEEQISSKQISSENPNNSASSSNSKGQRELQEEMKDEKEQSECLIFQQMKSYLKKHNSTEDINTSASIQSCELQPRMFKITSSAQEPRIDQWWQILEAHSRGNPFKIEEEPIGEWDWRSDEIFPLVNQREDFLNSSQEFGSNQIVTNFKMLEASIALEELRLNTKNSSRVEQYQQSSGVGLDI